MHDAGVVFQLRFRIMRLKLLGPRLAPWYYLRRPSAMTKSLTINLLSYDFVTSCFFKNGKFVGTDPHRDNVGAGVGSMLPSFGLHFGVRCLAWFPKRRWRPLKRAERGQEPIRALFVLLWQVPGVSGEGWEATNNITTIVLIRLDPLVQRRLDRRRKESAINLSASQPLSHSAVPPSSIVLKLI